MRKRYLPLRHDTTVFALAQILVEVVFPEQELKYIQATVKQTTEYRIPKYPMPSYLQNRPHLIQGMCLLNLERSKSIPIDRIFKQSEKGVFYVQKGLKDSDEKYTVSIPDGTCSCPSFQTSKIPCKHMFAIFHHHNEWQWSSLPEELTNAPHLILDTSATKFAEPVQTECDYLTDSPTISSQIPSHTTDGRKLYRLQKEVEEALGHCRTLTFLTNDISALQLALTEVNKAMNLLKTAAVIPGGDNCPPTFKVLAKAGTVDFRNSKILCRAGVKRKHRSSATQSNIKKTRCHNELVATSKTVGRPKVKWSQRKKPVLIRQVSSPVKARMKKAAAIVKRGSYAIVNVEMPNLLPHTY